MFDVDVDVGVDLVVGHVDVVDYWTAFETDASCGKH